MTAPHPPPGPFDVLWALARPGLSRDPQRARDIIARAAQGAAGDCNADLDALERAELAEAEAAARAEAEIEADRQRTIDAADRETRRRQAAQAAAAASRRHPQGLRVREAGSGRAGHLRVAPRRRPRRRRT